MNSFEEARQLKKLSEALSSVADIPKIRLNQYGVGKRLPYVYSGAVRYEVPNNVLGKSINRLDAWPTAVFFDETKQLWMSECDVAEGKGKTLEECILNTYKDFVRQDEGSSKDEEAQTMGYALDDTYIDYRDPKNSDGADFYLVDLIRDKAVEPAEAPASKEKRVPALKKPRTPLTAEEKAAKAQLKAESAAKAEAQAEIVLNEWDEFLNARGFSYMGEDPLDDAYWYSGVWYASTEDPEKQPIRALCISKRDMIQTIDPMDKARGVISLYRIFIPYHKEGNIANDSREYLNHGAAGKRTLAFLGDPALIHAYSDIHVADPQKAWPRIEKAAQKANHIYN